MLRCTAGRWFGVMALVPIMLAVGTTVTQGDAAYQTVSRDYPGLATGMVTALLRATVETASLVCFGGLCCALFFSTRRGRNRLKVNPDAPELRIARTAAWLWAGAASVSVPFDAADANGLAIGQVLHPGFVDLLSATNAPIAWVVTVGSGLVVAWRLSVTRRWSGLLIPLAFASIGLLAPVAVGHVLVGPNHDAGSDTAYVQTIIASALWGVLTVLAARVLGGERLDVVVTVRIARMCLYAVPACLVTELGLAAFRLQGADPLETATGWLIGVRITTLLGLAGLALFGWRRHVRAGLDDRVIASLSVAVVGLAALWVATVATMARVPSPQYFVPTSITEVFLGYDVDLAPTVGSLLTEWRINVFFLLLAGVCLIAYGWAIRRLRRRGDRWPVGRTISWSLGWLVIVLATSSGLGMYSGPVFSVHMAVHMALNMLAPILLAMGGITTLLIRATTANPRHDVSGPHEWVVAITRWRFLRFAGHPLLVLVLFVGSYYALYLTGLFGVAMPEHWAHQLMNLHFLLSGYLYYNLIIGADPPPVPLPHLGRLGLVIAAMPFHAFFGVVLMTTDEVLAENFYRSLDLPWTLDLLADQQLGGGIAWAGGELPLLIVIVALGVQWWKADSRQAARKDRHLDRGLDDELDAYNALLRQLAERSPEGPK